MSHFLLPEDVPAERGANECLPLFLRKGDDVVFKPAGCIAEEGVQIVFETIDGISAGYEVTKMVADSLPGHIRKPYVFLKTVTGAWVGPYKICSAQASRAFNKALLDASALFVLNDLEESSEEDEASDAEASDAASERQGGYWDVQRIERVRYVDGVKMVSVRWRPSWVRVEDLDAASQEMLEAADSTIPK